MMNAMSVRKRGADGESASPLARGPVSDQHAGPGLDACLQLMGKLSHEQCVVLRDVAGTNAQKFGQAALKSGAIDRDTLVYALGVQRGFLKPVQRRNKLPSLPQTAQNPYGEAAKAYRDLVRRLTGYSQSAASPADMIALTGVGDGVKVSTIVENMLTAASQLKKRSLLIDVSDQHGTFDRLFEDNDIGTATSLRRTIFTYADIMTHRDHPAMRNIDRTMASIAEGIGAIAEEYSLIVVVTPNFQELGPCERIWAHCSGVVPIVSRNITTRGTLEKLSKRLKASRAGSLGFVFEG